MRCDGGGGGVSARGMGLCLLLPHIGGSGLPLGGTPEHLPP